MSEDAVPDRYASLVARLDESPGSATARDVEMLVSLFDRENVDAKARALEILGSVGVRDPSLLAESGAFPTVIDALDDADSLESVTDPDEDGRVPENAFEVIRQIVWTDPDVLVECGVVDELIAALDDQSALVRHGAARSLGEIGNRAPGRLVEAGAVEPLVEAIGDEEYAVHRAAVEGLGAANPNELAGTGAFDPILNALRNGSSGQRPGAAEVVGRFGHDGVSGDAVDPFTDAVAAVVGALRDDEETMVRKVAADALGDVGSHQPSILRAAEGVDGLVGALDDGDRFVRLAAARSLGQVAREDPSLAERAVERLEPLTEDPDERVRETASEAIDEIRHSMT